MVLNPVMSKRRGSHTLCAVVAAYGVPPKVDSYELHTAPNHVQQAAEPGTQGSERIVVTGGL